MSRRYYEGVKPASPYTYERSLNYVLWLLARKAYTEAELRGKLAKKEAAPEIVERVMARLAELRYLDDALYAEGYVQSRKHRKGRLALRRELVYKGVAETVVEETLAAIAPAEQLELAAALLEKQAWRFKKDDPRKSYAKAYAFLARRGFTSEVVKEALEQAKLFDKS